MKPTIEQSRSQQKNFRLNNRASCLLRRAKHYAKKRNEPFDLTHEWIQERLTRGVCEVTGVPFRVACGPRQPWTPSLDQIDPRKGYTKDNVRVVVWIYNTAKQNWTDADVRVMAEALVKGSSTLPEPSTPVTRRLSEVVVRRDGIRVALVCHGHVTWLVHA